MASRSIGRVTRSSTSDGDAPGNPTITSAKGTTICGSSSRGVLMIASAPRSNAAIMMSEVSLESSEAAARRPARP